MKKLMAVCLFLGCIAEVQARQKSSTGLQFFEGSWSELVQAAKQQDKMIFVDMYTDWCGPCKTMNKEVFTKKVVGDKYNPAFLIYKLDAEKGEGIAVAKQFNVRAFPTFLYLNSRGDLVQRAEGFKVPADFNKLADDALQLVADSITLGKMEAAFKQGQRDPAFLRDYISRLRKLDMDNTKALDVYFKALSWQELRQEELVVFIGKNISSTATPALVFVIDQYVKLSAAAKLSLTNRLYSQLVERGASAALQQQRLHEVKQLLDYADRLEGRTDKQRLYQDRVRLHYAGLVRDVELIKTTGYRLVQPIKDISIDSMKREDACRFAAFMEPYIKGEKDSTQYSSWQEEKPYLMALYSNEVANRLYFVANAFVALPDGDDQALRDALVWARKAKEVNGGVKVYGELVEGLEKRVGK
jgi:thiol-disulfide isomerase/thioredoxin